MCSVTNEIKELTRLRVLIVDDNPQVRRELRTLLPLAGDLSWAKRTMGW
jgi:CheY-like chemotaxis protein